MPQARFPSIIDRGQEIKLKGTSSFFLLQFRAHSELVRHQNHASCALFPPRTCNKGFGTSKSSIRLHTWPKTVRIGSKWRHRSSESFGHDAAWCDLTVATSGTGICARGLLGEGSFLVGSRPAQIRSGRSSLGNAFPMLLRQGSLKYDI